jgi:hypothetical protein
MNDSSKSTSSNGNDGSTSDTRQDVEQVLNAAIRQPGGWWFALISEEFAFLLELGFRLARVTNSGYGDVLSYVREPLELIFERQPDSWYTDATLREGWHPDGLPEIRYFSAVLNEQFPDSKWPPSSGYRMTPDTDGAVGAWAKGARLLWGSG